MMVVKGAAVASLPHFISKKFGEDGLDKWLRSLPDDTKRVFSYPVLSSSWFPLKGVLVKPTENMCNLFYNGDVKGAWESGRYSADHGLRGIYKMFIRFGSAEYIINRATVILPTYYNPSELKVANSSKNQAVMHIIKFPEMDKIIEMRIGGWMERALELSGCNNVQVKVTQSLSGGDPLTEYITSWK